MQTRQRMIVLAGLLAASCFYDVDRSRIGEVPDSGAPVSTDSSGETGDVQGTVTIGDGLEPQSYAVADLFVVALAKCPAMGDKPDAIQKNLVGATMVKQVGFSKPGIERGFSLNGLKPGKVYLWGFLDSDGSSGGVMTPEKMPLPNKGDALPQDGTLCVETTAVAGKVVENQDLTLVMTLPMDIF